MEADCSPISCNIWVVLVRAHIHYCSFIRHLCGSNSCPTHGSANAQVFVVIVGPSFFNLWNNAQICVSGMCCGAEQGLSYPNDTKHS